MAITFQNSHREKGLFHYRAQKCRWKREKEERKCGCLAAYVYRIRENKRIQEDKQEMKGMGRIEQQLEHMQMVSGSYLHCVWGAAFLLQRRIWRVCVCVCMCQRWNTIC